MISRIVRSSDPRDARGILAWGKKIDTGGWQFPGHMHSGPSMCVTHGGRRRLACIFPFQVPQVAGGGLW